jgi:uncharacterized membrane protein
LILILFFAGFYANISIVNHLNFRTNWFDLGLYTHHIYNYSALNFSDLKINLSDHFDLFLVCISPLRYVFGQYTLLIVQIGFIILGSFGVFLYSEQQLKNKQRSLIMQITFLISFAVISSVAFDYHSNVIAACLVPFLLLFYNAGHKIKFIITWLVIVITKENVMFNTSVLLILLPFFHRDEGLKKLSFTLGVIGLGLFWIIVSKIMPAFSNTEVYANFKYTSVGHSKNFSDMFVFICSHPIETVKLMFVNTSGEPRYDLYKLEAHCFIFLCGGFLLFRKPLLLLVSVPIYLQKFLHDSENIWGLSFQYNIDFLPLILMGMISFLKKEHTNVFIHKNAAYFFLAINLILTIRMLDNTMSYIRRSTVRFYQGSHYTSDVDKKAFKELYDLLPRQASLSAQSNLTPHLCLRDSISLFKGNDHHSQYVFLSDSSMPYPLNVKAYKEVVQELSSDTNYRLVEAKGNVKLFKRKH